MICSTQQYADPATLLADDIQRRACVHTVARGGQYYDGPAPRPVIREAVAAIKARADRRSNRGQAEKARRAEPGRILRLADQRRREREAAAEQRLAKRIAAGKLAVARTKQLQRAGALTRYARAGHGRDRDANTMGVVRCLVRAIGTIGEQAEADLDNFHAGEDFSGKKGRNHRLEGSELAGIEVRRDFTAALVTMRDYRSFGSAAWGGYDGHYGSRGGSSYRCYLVVRDTTTGEAHILRVPPRFGNSDTQAYHDFGECRPIPKRACKDGRKYVQARTDNRIHAAVAWTFGLKPHEYQPAVEA